MISYAQNMEDVMLWRALKHVEDGFYIDLGAAWPDEHSVTKHFYEHGWHGINVEPNPKLYDLYASRRTRDINLKVAVSDQEGETDINFIEDTGLSTTVDSFALQHQAAGWSTNKRKVKVTTLLAICRQHVKPDQPIHFLKVDIEGLEEAALRGNDWMVYRPWIVVVEATLPMTQTEAYANWEPVLMDANYAFAYADGLNRFYVATEQAGLLPAFKYPPNVFDGFLPSTQQEAEVKAVQAEAKAQDANVNAQHAEGKALQAEAEAQQAGVKAQQAQVKAAQAESKAQAAKVNAQQAEARAKQSEAKAVQSEAEAQIAEQHLIAAQAAASQSRAQMQQSLDLLQAGYEQQARLLNRTDAAETAAAKLATDLQEVTGALAAAQQELYATHQANNHHWQELERTRSALHQAQQATHHHWQLSDQRQHLIDAIYNTKSWRVTAPLRWCLQQKRLLSQHGATARAKALLKKVLRAADNRLQAVPESRLKLVAVSRRLGLHTWLKTLTTNYDASTKVSEQIAETLPVPTHVQVQPQAVVAEPVTPPIVDNLQSLSPRARQIYSALKTAIAQKQKGGA